MPIEAELTAVVSEPDRVRSLLAQRANPERAIYKEPPVADGEGSKPEHEAVVSDAGVLHTMLLGIGLIDVIASPSTARTTASLNTAANC